MRSFWKIASTASLGALVFAGAANAADLGGMPAQPPLLESAPLLVDEFSSGWYLRGDLGYRFNNTVDSVSNLGAPPGMRSTDFDTSWVFGAGVGYKWEWFRTDLTADYGTRSKFSGDNRFGSPDITANIDTVTALVNVYGDLGTWWGFTPYVGVGAGIAHVQAANFNIAHMGPNDADSTGSWNFAWAYMAGISYKVWGNYNIDIGYRHVNMGDVTTGVIRPGGNELAFKKVQSDEVRIGFRYVLD